MPDATQVFPVSADDQGYTNPAMIESKLATTDDIITVMESLESPKLRDLLSVIHLRCVRVCLFLYLLPTKGKRCHVVIPCTTWFCNYVKTTPCS